MSRPVPPRIKRFAAAKQRRLDELLQKNSEGTISPLKKARLEKLVGEAEQLMVENARRLAAFAASDRDVPTDAVPVTIWVKPEPAER